METFQQIYVLDLHGSTKPKERTPSGVHNENVFDIMKGVAISIFVRDEKLPRKICFGDVWGRRIEKYRTAAHSNVLDLARDEIKPRSPFYFFSTHTDERSAGWREFDSLADIFEFRSAGMLTARDGLNIAFDGSELLSRLTRFVALSPQDARNEFDLGPDKRDWSVNEAQDDVLASSRDEARLRRIAYRPFDRRFVFYTGRSKGLIGQPARPLSTAVDASGVALGTVRRVEEGEFRHAHVFEFLPDGHSVSSKEMTHAFPLYKSDASEKKGGDSSRNENISERFRAALDARYDHHYTPEELLGYIYAVLHASTYRSRYSEFLRNEFPRVPFPEAKAHFDRLKTLGTALVDAHLLRMVPRQRLAAYHGKGRHEIETVRYSPQEQAIWINKTQHFAPVPEDVWNFHIGGYQVLDKYLKSRKGRVLSLDEIEHVSAVADALAFTITQMAEIDAAYTAAFPGSG
jgi:predicted helicase